MPAESLSIPRIAAVARHGMGRLRCRVQDCVNVVNFIRKSR